MIFLNEQRGKMKKLESENRKSGVKHILTFIYQCFASLGHTVIHKFTLMKEPCKLQKNKVR